MRGSAGLWYVTHIILTIVYSATFRSRSSIVVLSIQYSIFMFFATHAITCSHPLGLNLLTEQAETCRIVLDICDQHEAVH